MGSEPHLKFNILHVVRDLIVIRVLTIMCCLVFRVEAEVGECFPLEVIVLFHEYKDFFFVLSLFFFSKQCQLDISIDSLTSNSATEVVEVLAEVFFEALPCFWVTTCIILERHSELLLNMIVLLNLTRLRIIAKGSQLHSSSSF